MAHTESSVWTHNADLDPEVVAKISPLITKQVGTRKIETIQAAG